MLKYIQFFEKNKIVDYGCVMVYPKMDNWDEIVPEIDPKDVYYNKENPKKKPGGVEKKPHVTILYGFHKDVKNEDIKEIVDKYKDSEINIEIDGIGNFDTKDFDVVKFNVKCPILHKMNKEFSELPHTSDFPKYSPHMTIAYVNSGESKKYLNKDIKYKFKADKIVYTSATGEKSEYKLT